MGKQRKARGAMRINGKLVVDAKRKVTLVIQSQDIRRGNTRDPNTCAAAQACCRQLHAKAARVHLARTYVQIGNKWVRYHTPGSLRTEIVSFDRGARFSPGRYVLAPLQPTKHATGKQQGGKWRGRTGAKRRPYRVLTGLRVHGAGR